MPMLDALEHLLEKHGYVTQWSKVSRNQIYRDLMKDVDVTSEHMRKMVLGERTPRPEFMEVLAARFNEHPRVFREYRRYELDKALDADPAFADTLWEIALTENRLKESASDVAHRGKKVPGPQAILKSS